MRTPRTVQHLALAGAALATVIAWQVRLPRAVEAEPGRTLAEVVSVKVVGEPGAYRFDVGIRSPDVGCEQYADWWEVVSEEGSLIYRRVLSHSHVDEQPFTRSGGPVPIATDEVVWIRAHMHPAGYGGTAFKGSVEKGFETTALAASFAADLARQPPQSPECRW